MDVERARTLVAGERRRIEAALAGLTGDEQADEGSRDDQAGEAAEVGTEIQHEMTDQALTAGLEAELAAVARAEARLADGSYGLSVDSGARIPDDRLEVEPLAERTVEEQALFEQEGR